MSEGGLLPKLQIMYLATGINLGRLLREPGVDDRLARTTVMVLVCSAGQHELVVRQESTSFEFVEDFLAIDVN